jgi:hypothetical protein
MIGLTSCVSTQEIVGAIEAHLSPEYVEYSKPKEDFIQVNTLLDDNIDSLVSVEKEKRYFVPAIVFWSWENTMDCKINYSYYENVFTKILFEKAELYHLPSLLKNKRIEVDIVKLPSQFLFINKTSLLFGGFFYFYNYDFSLSLNDNEFKLVVRIIDEDTVITTNAYQYFLKKEVVKTKQDSYSLFYQYISDLTLEFEQASSVLIQDLTEIKSNDY